MTEADLVAQTLFEFTVDRVLLTRTTGHGDPAPQHTVWPPGPERSGPDGALDRANRCSIPSPPHGGGVGRMVGYAELHCHTNFSFLDGASHPEELAEEAHRLGLTGPRGHRPRRLLRRGPLRGGAPRSSACPPSSAPS